jgi:hypothetical protein
MGMARRTLTVERSEVAYNDTRGHGQFKATRPEKREKKGVALLPVFLDF